MSIKLHNMSALLVFGLLLGSMFPVAANPSVALAATKKVTAQKKSSSPKPKIIKAVSSSSKKSAKQQPSACALKGNISSSKEKIYHAPGCASYTATIIDESKGERWFCTDKEAVDAGWRKAKNC